MCDCAFSCIFSQVLLWTYANDFSVGVDLQTKKKFKHFKRWYIFQQYLPIAFIFSFIFNLNIGTYVPVGIWEKIKMPGQKKQNEQFS